MKKDKGYTDLQELYQTLSYEFTLMRKKPTTRIYECQNMWATL